MIEKFKEKGYVEAYTITSPLSAKHCNIRKVLTDWKKSKRHTNYSNPSNYYIHVVFIDCDRLYSAYHPWKTVFKTKDEAIKEIERIKGDDNGF